MCSGFFYKMSNDLDYMVTFSWCEISFTSQIYETNVGLTTKAGVGTNFDITVGDDLLGVSRFSMSFAGLKRGTVS